MKKVYVIALCILSLVTVISFQNCSKAQVAAFEEKTKTVTADSSVETFDESAKFSITSSMNLKHNFRTIYEYKIAGGHRRPCSTEDDYLDGFEDRCSNASGFRVLSEGTLVKFYQFIDRKEIQYNVGYYDKNQLDVFMKRIDEIIKTNAPLVDLNEGGPICMDAPTVTQSISNDQQNDFIIAQRQDCHEFARGDDLIAIKVADMMERLYRRIVKISAPQKHILVEKRMQIGFRPVEMPGDISLKIYSDGRVVKKSEYTNQAQNTNELLAVLSRKELADLYQRLGQLYGYKLELKDLDHNEPMCADAPTTTYSFHELLNHTMDVRKPPKDAYFKVDFAKHSNCHRFLDPRHEQASENLIKFVNQFN